MGSTFRHSSDEIEFEYEANFSRMQIQGWCDTEILGSGLGFLIF